MHVAFPDTQERGQARLPDLELIRVELRIHLERLSRLDQMTEYQNLRVGKVGLPPLCLSCCVYLGDFPSAFSSLS